MKKCSESNRKLAEMGLGHLQMVKIYGWWEVVDSRYTNQESVQDYCKKKLLGRIARGERPVDKNADDYYPKTIFHPVGVGTGKRVRIPCCSVEQWKAYKAAPQAFYLAYVQPGE